MGNCTCWHCEEQGTQEARRPATQHKFIPSVLFADMHWWRTSQNHHAAFRLVSWCPVKFTISIYCVLQTLVQWHGYSHVVVHSERCAPGARLILCRNAFRAFLPYEWPLARRTSVSRISRFCVLHIRCHANISDPICYFCRGGCSIALRRALSTRRNAYPRGCSEIVIQRYCQRQNPILPALLPHEAMKQNKLTDANLIHGQQE